MCSCPLSRCSETLSHYSWIYTMSWYLPQLGYTKLIYCLVEHQGKEVGSVSRKEIIISMTTFPVINPDYWSLTTLKCIISNTKHLYSHRYSPSSVVVCWHYYNTFSVCAHCWYELHYRNQETPQGIVMCFDVTVTVLVFYFML